jgi:uncharacterized protein
LLVRVPCNYLDRSIAFYKAVLGKEVQKISEEGWEFGLLPHDENNVSGCLSLMPDRKPSVNGPLVYLNVDGRIHDALASIETNGGKIIHEAVQMGPYGARAIIQDTEGNIIALWASKL